MKILAALSLLLSLVSVTFWVRSYWITDDFFLIYRIRGAEQLTSHRGKFYFQHSLPGDDIRGGILRFSHNATRTNSFPGKRWQPVWRIFHVDGLPPPDPAIIRKARDQINAAETARPRPLKDTSRDAQQHYQAAADRFLAVYKDPASTDLDQREAADRLTVAEEELMDRPDVSWWRLN